MADVRQQISEPPRAPAEHLARSHCTSSFIEAALFLVHHLPGALDDDDGPGRTLRFRHSPALGFATQEFDVVTTPTTTTLTGSFFGLCGSSTPLPLYIAEDAASGGDSGEVIRDLLDVLHHRLLSSLVRALTNLDAGRLLTQSGNAWTRRLLDLAGVNQAEARDPVTLAILPIILSGDRSKRALQSALTIFLAPYTEHAPVEIKPLTGGWIPLHSTQLSRLGSSTTVLGRTFLAGTRAYLPSSAARIVIGPIRSKLAHQFKEGGAGTRALEKVLEILAPPSIRISADLRIRAEDAKSATLGQSQLGSDFRLHRSSGDQFQEEIVKIKIGRQ